MDRRWSDLLPDLLREISGHLRHTTDYVRFHAICKAWRSSRDPAATSTRAQSMLPWLLSNNGDNSLNLRCVFSKTSYVVPRPSSDTRRNWVCGADGASFRYFTALPHPALHDPLVAGGLPTILQQAPFPQPKDRWPEYPSGIIYSDGTVFLYKMFHPIGYTADFRAAILRPGENTWMVVERNFESEFQPDFGREFSVAYHAGKILVTLDATVWHVLKPWKQDDKSTDEVVPSPWKPGEQDECWSEKSYAVESRGDLLWITVTVGAGYPTWCRLARALSVSVHALESAPTTGKMRWVRKNGPSLADRVFFLGSPNSFAVDASRKAGNGGFTYFVCDNYYEGFRNQRICVIGYNLLNDKAEIIEWLPQTWRSEIGTWLILQPTMAPNQEISERLREAPKWNRLQNVAQVAPRSIIQITTTYLGHCFSILVCNLPPTVNSIQLRHFFSKHGQVYKANIINCKKNKMSHDRGLVTLSTLYAYKAYALGALNGLVWDGYKLEVSLVNEVVEKHRHRSHTKVVAKSS